MEVADYVKDDGISGVAILAHEIYEGFQHQGKGISNYETANDIALRLQGMIDGYTNVKNIAQDTILFGTTEFTYTTNNGKNMKTTVNIKDNNFLKTTTTIDVTPKIIIPEPSKYQDCSVCAEYERKQLELAKQLKKYFNK